SCSVSLREGGWLITCITNSTGRSHAAGDCTATPGSRLRDGALAVFHHQAHARRDAPAWDRDLVEHTEIDLPARWRHDVTRVAALIVEELHIRLLGHAERARMILLPAKILRCSTRSSSPGAGKTSTSLGSPGPLVVPGETGRFAPVKCATRPGARQRIAVRCRSCQRGSFMGSLPEQIERRTSNWKCSPADGTNAALLEPVGSRRFNRSVKFDKRVTQLHRERTQQVAAPRRVAGLPRLLQGSGGGGHARPTP